MGLIGTALRSVKIGAYGPLDDFWYQPAPSGQNLSGVPITPDGALRISIAWACVRLISESIGALPLILYQRQADGGRVRATSHPLYDLLHDAPNAYQTAIEFLSMMQLHLLLRGNAYAEILAGPRGPVDQLIPLHPDRVRLDEQPDGSLRYRLRQRDGTERVLLEDEVFHLRGMSLDGKTGVSVIQYAAQSMGLASAAEAYSASFFGRGSRPAGILKTAGKLSKDGAERMRAEWQAAYGGSGNSHRTAVLEEGLEWTPISFNAEDSQLVQSREFQASDIARWFGVPLHMVQLESKDTAWGSGIESLALGYVTFTLTPWIQRWEQKISSRLIVLPQAFFAEFLLDGLLRSSTTERYAAYQIAAGGNAPWMTRNEIRRRENLNPLPGLDTPLEPLNMGDAGQPPPPKPSQNGTSPNGVPSKNGSANGHAALEDGLGSAFARDAAERVARREVAALTRASKRAGADEAAWWAEVQRFYGEHGVYVSEAMHLSAEGAEQYACEQLAYLAKFGPNGLGNGFSESSADRLLALATGED